MKSIKYYNDLLIRYFVLYCDMMSLRRQKSDCLAIVGDGLIVPLLEDLLSLW